MLNGEFDTAQPKKRPPPPGAPADCVSSVEMYYIDRQDRHRVARVHYYERPDGSIGGKGRHDPKELYVNGTRYHLHSGAWPWHRVRRDPSTLFREGGWMYRKYVAWRNFKCRRFGR